MVTLLHLHCKTEFGLCAWLDVVCRYALEKKACPTSVYNCKNDMDETSALNQHHSVADLVFECLIHRMFNKFIQYVITSSDLSSS